MKPSYHPIHKLASAAVNIDQRRNVGDILLDQR